MRKYKIFLDTCMSVWRKGIVGAEIDAETNACKRARKAGWSEENIKDFMREANCKYYPPAPEAE